MVNENSPLAMTITNEEIVRRLEVVERRLDELAAVLRVKQPQPGWLNEIRGMFANEPAFGEVIKYGRQLRNSDRPADHDDLNE